MSERVEIDDEYTYEFDAGYVRILRHGQRWLGSPSTGREGVLNAPGAWIAAANALALLRAEAEDLRQRLAEVDGSHVHSEES